MTSGIRIIHVWYLCSKSFYGVVNRIFVQVVYKVVSVHAHFSNIPLLVNPAFEYHILIESIAALI